jgi:hypothetical protein
VVQLVQDGNCPHASILDGERAFQERVADAHGPRERHRISQAASEPKKGKLDENRVPRRARQTTPHDSDIRIV